MIGTHSNSSNSFFILFFVLFAIYFIALFIPTLLVINYSLQYQLIKEGRNTTIKYRWEAIEEFDMPLFVNSSNKDFWIYPNNNWQEMSLGKIDSREFSVKEELFLLDIKKVK